MPVTVDIQYGGGTQEVQPLFDAISEVPYVPLISWDEWDLCRNRSHQRAPTARDFSRAVGYQMAGGSEKTLLTEAVCEFIIFSNLPVLSDRRGFPCGSSSTGRLWRNSGQNPLERR